MLFEEQIKEAQNLILNSKYTICLTGAGISTPSGIPDFRSPVSGIWEKVDPMEVATIWAFKQNPKKFYDFFSPMIDTIMYAKPNPAHIALAQLEEKGLLQLIITQNIDGLHQKAGSKNVAEVHGNFKECICLECRRIFSSEELILQLKGSKKIPTCEVCGGVIKPNVVLFGETLPLDVLYRAQRAAQDCEVMLCVGSSLVVYPAAGLPEIAYSSGAKIIVINLQPTYIDAKAKVVIPGEVDKVLPEIAKGIV